MKLLGRLQPVGIPGLGASAGTAATATRATSAAAPGRILGDAVPLQTPPRLDPRLYQITVLASLLVYGMAWLGLDIHPGRAVAILAAALLTQWAAPRSPSCRASTPGARSSPVCRSACSSGRMIRWLAMLAAVVAVASKFLLRVRGKHVFNPTNFALVAMLLVTGQVWASPGQWGSAAVFAFLLASAGGLVVNRAARADVTWPSSRATRRSGSADRSGSAIPWSSRCTAWKTAPSSSSPSS